MRSSADKVASYIIAASAVGIAISVVYQSFLANGVDSASAEPDFIEDWQDVMPHAISIGGSPSAPVTVLVLSDLECPVCRTFHSTLADVLTEHAGDVQAYYLSFPLPYHRFAEQAARAAECADGQAGFRPFIDAVYAKQDSLGLKSWVDFALEVGLPDTTAFAACVNATTPLPRIAAGLDFGERITILGTPTVLINGWRYPYTPSRQDLADAIDAVRTGGEPKGKAQLIWERERESS